MRGPCKKCSHDELGKSNQETCESLDSFKYNNDEGRGSTTLRFFSGNLLLTDV